MNGMSLSMRQCFVDFLKKQQIEFIVNSEKKSSKMLCNSMIRNSQCTADTLVKITIHLLIRGETETFYINNTTEFSFVFFQLKPIHIPKYLISARFHE